jgi:hypothetical protein
MKGSCFFEMNGSCDSFRSSSSCEISTSLTPDLLDKLCCVNAADVVRIGGYDVLPDVKDARAVSIGESSLLSHARNLGVRWSYRE